MRRFQISVFAMCFLLLGPTLLLQGQNYSSDLLMAARNGDVQAMVAIGADLFYGKGVKRDIDESFRWFQKAADAGSADGKAWVGSAYFFGHGVEQDQEKGRKLIQEAANENSPVGLEYLGVMHQSGSGVEQDYITAVHLLSSAASLGNLTALNRLGHMYLDGMGMPRDRVEAVRLFKQGAGKDDPWCELSLGELYRDEAHINGKQAKYTQAMALLKRSAEQGNGRAAYELAWFYMSGTAVPQDYGIALPLVVESANQDIPPAQATLGHLLENGLGVKVNLVKAYVWYRVAAHNGDQFGLKEANRLQSSLSSRELDEATSTLSLWLHTSVSPQ